MRRKVCRKVCEPPREVSGGFPKGFGGVPKVFGVSRKVTKGPQKVPERFREGSRKVSGAPERFPKGSRKVSERFPNGFGPRNFSGKGAILKTSYLKHLIFTRKVSAGSETFGNRSGIFRGPFGNLSGTFRKPFRKPFGNLSGTFREPLGSPPETFQEPSLPEHNQHCFFQIGGGDHRADGGQGGR